MSREEILVAIREIAVEVLGVEPGVVTEQATFKEDLDADSLDLVEVVMAIEERMEIAIPEDELGDITTVGQAVDIVIGKVAARA